ncbi:serine hydrolase domain-containing protein [Occallatibacter savannae]|uniref:serine hydrolase domain-containing protein n=1 Tax=Occallatibacter savannae TaxID=1002691 RepID=UPI000D693797|nr:serine hydrolase domain-containing protein [Occallatibacter savannae]
MNPVRTGTAFAAILATAIALPSQNLPPEVTAKVDKVFARWNKPDSPGCALGIYKDGRLAYAHGYGMANLNDDIPITPQTVFHVASMSKQFTAASILLLADQGKLSLDDDVHKYIPELPDFGQHITLRHLMHHTSGLRDQWSLLGLAGWRYSQDLITDDDVMSVLVHQKALNFKPGEKYMYSNTGFTLLAIVVKRVSGMSFREFTTKNIFEPLGMTHTHFRDDHEEVIKHDALGYEQAGEGKPFRMSLTNFDTAGATSLHTTVEDLQLWDENFYHPRIGGPNFIQHMLEKGKLNSGKDQDYASGLAIGTYRGLPTVGHGGADAGYRSDIERFPDQHFGASVLCNAAEAEPGSLLHEVADIILAGQFKDPPAAPSTPKPVSTSVVAMTADQMKAVAGTYWKQEDDDYQRIVLKDGALLLDFGSDEYHPLKPFAESHFHVGEVPWGEHMDLHFVPASAGKPAHIDQSWDGGKPDTYEWVATVEPTPDQLAEFTGSYTSEEIDPVYRFKVVGDKLTLMRLKNKPDSLRPTLPDVFIGQIGTIHFTRDANHRISGFVLNAGRFQGFQFSRNTESR